MKKKKIRIIALILMIALVLVGLTQVLPQNKTEPGNPLLTQAEPLKTEQNTGTGGAETQGDAQTAGGEEQDQTQQEQNASDQEDSSQEEQQQEQTEQENQNQPEQTQENASQSGTDRSNSTQTGNQQNAQTSDGNASQNGNAGQNGTPDSQNPGTDDSGKLPEDNGGQNTDQPGNGENPGETEESLITDLYSRIITTSELSDDTLAFYAYYSDEKVAANIKVNYRHEKESGNGTWLQSEDDRNYETKLKLGKNYITIYYTDKEGTRNWSRIVLTYQAEKADASRPEIGEHPPVIETNLDGWSGDINTSEFTFTVSAKTWEGKRIYSDSIQVMLDGQPVTNPTGNGIFEYVLKFDRPKVGDYENHKVSVLAWDSDGNSRYVEYQFRYQFHNDGEDLGSVHVIIDATTVECGIVDEGDIDLQAGDTAASVVLKMLDEYGYSYRASGSDSSEFYLGSISRADAFRGCHIGDRLKGLLERDGITFTSAGSRDELGEFDFTRGSGWMYFINGSLCPGKAMSAWTLNGGETISLRFTLAYGKDVGGSSSAEGTLSSYCAQWIDGQVKELGHDYQETARVEAGPDTDGYIEYTCSKCGETKRDVLPATGGDTDPAAPEEQKLRWKKAETE